MRRAAMNLTFLLGRNLQCWLATLLFSPIRAGRAPLAFNVSTGSQKVHRLAVTGCLG